MTLGLLVALENMDKYLSDIRIWGPPLKIKISTIGLRHVLSWPRVSLEPKFHDPVTFGGFGKCEQSFIRYPADI